MVFRIEKASNAVPEVMRMNGDGRREGIVIRSDQRWLAGRSSELGIKSGGNTSPEAA